MLSAPADRVVKGRSTYGGSDRQHDDDPLTYEAVVPRWHAPPTPALARSSAISDVKSTFVDGRLRAELLHDAGRVRVDEPRVR
jgi:hypothetical protein